MKLFCALLTLLLFTSHPSLAARGFNTTLGSGATDAVQTNYGTLVNTTRTYAVWFFLRASAVQNRMWSNIVSASENDGFYDNASLTLVFQRAYTSTAGTWTIPIPSTNAWHHLVVVFNPSSLPPVMYLDGVAQTVTQTQAPVGSVTTTTGAYYVGNDANLNRAWDGKLAEFSMWNGALSLTEAQALHNGASPLKIRTANLITYIPLNGTQSGEADFGLNHSTQTITGTKFQPGPPFSLLPFTSDTGQ